MDRLDASTVRVGVALMVLVKETERMRRLIAASDGDVGHAANVYAVVTAARVGSAMHVAREQRRRAYARAGL